MLTGKIKSESWPYHLVFSNYILIIFSRWPGTGSEDIGAARMNFKSDLKLDFWGGSSSFFYGHFPNLFGKWETNLLILQCSLCFIGILILVNLSQKIEKITDKIFFLTISYIAFFLSSQGTRDGLLTSLLVLGFAIILYALKRLTEGMLVLGTLIGAAIVILALSLRPWVSIGPTLIIVVLAFSSRAKFPKAVKSKMFMVLIIIGLTVGGLVVDRSLIKIEKLQKSYPEQQVMLMDFLGNYCLGTNVDSANISKQALGLFSSDPNFTTTVCQSYRLDSWVNLLYLNTLSTAGIKSSFVLIKNKEDVKYQEVRNYWINMITSDPVTYFQVKQMEILKLGTASDMRQLRLLEKPAEFSSTIIKFKHYLVGIILLPADLMVTFHLISVFSMLIIWLVIFLYLVRSKTISEWKDFSILIAAPLSGLLWLGTSSIAYIGSNGRYTYTAALLMLGTIVFQSILTSNNQQPIRGSNE